MSSSYGLSDPRPLRSTLRLRLVYRIIAIHNNRYWLHIPSRVSFLYTNQALNVCIHDACPPMPLFARSLLQFALDATVLVSRLADCQSCLDDTCYALQLTRRCYRSGLIRSLAWLNCTQPIVDRYSQPQFRRGGMPRRYSSHSWQVRSHVLIRISHFLVPSDCN